MSSDFSDKRERGIWTGNFNTSSSSRVAFSEPSAVHIERQPDETAGPSQSDLDALQLPPPPQSSSVQCLQAPRNDSPRRVAVEHIEIGANKAMEEVGQSAPGRSRLPFPGSYPSILCVIFNFALFSMLLHLENNDYDRIGSRHFLLACRLCSILFVHSPPPPLKSLSTDLYPCPIHFPVHMFYCLVSEPNSLTTSPF